MSIEHLYNKSFIILRLAVTSGQKRGFISTGTIDGHLQRLDDAAGSQIWGVEGATHRAWVGIDENVKEGDQIIDSESNKYSVLAVVDEGRDFAINEHKELILKIYLPPILPKT